MSTTTSPRESALFTVFACFSLLVVFGLGLVGMGQIAGPARPHFQLDRVLDPSELADAEKREATLKLLQRAQSGNEWILWTCAGAGVAFFATVGLVASVSMKLKQGTVGTNSEPRDAAPHES